MIRKNRTPSLPTLHRTHEHEFQVVADGETSATRTETDGSFEAKPVPMTEILTAPVYGALKPFTLIEGRLKDTELLRKLLKTTLELTDKETRCPIPELTLQTTKKLKKKNQ
jgi:hypothetical protein